MPTFKRKIVYYICDLFGRYPEIEREWGQDACVYGLASGGKCPKDCPIIKKYNEIKKRGET